jgi:hypothetical protein
MPKQKPAKETTPGPSSKEVKSHAFQLAPEPVVEAEAGAEAEEEADSIPQETSAKPYHEDLGSLPDAYNSGSLYLIARDPHWLFTYWDIDWTKHSAAGKEGARVCVRLYADGELESATDIHPAARNWYLPARKPDANYHAELVIISGDHEEVIAASDAARTPPAAVSNGERADFATVPLHLSFEQLLDMVRASMAEGESLIEALSRVQRHGLSVEAGSRKVSEWTPEQKQLLAAIVGSEVLNQIEMGSGDIDRLIRQGLEAKLHTESASELAARGRITELWGPGESSLFSGFGASWSAQPFSQEWKGREFFMHVNAEVIFYGGTHPDAQVTINGEPIKLNPDGSFRYHYKFPDGDFEIPIIARSPDGVEERSASLSFRRGTARQGDVAHTGQPAELSPLIGRK